MPSDALIIAKARLNEIEVARENAVLAITAAYQEIADKFNVKIRILTWSTSIVGPDNILWDINNMYLPAKLKKVKRKIEAVDELCREYSLELSNVILYPKSS